MRLLLLIALLNTIACASKPPINVIVPAPALREVFRGGAIQGLEDNNQHYTGAPGQYDLVEHTCTSTPIFNLQGQYVRTSVKCW